MERNTIFQIMLVAVILLVALAVFVSASADVGRYQMLHPTGSTGLFVLDSKTGELVVVIGEGDSAVVLQTLDPFSDNR